jgi:beta-lactam-binding protein with PASTA domain
VPKGTSIILYTDEETVADPGKVAVPSLLGLGLTQARLKLTEAGLTMSAQGSGFCVSQDPPAGTLVEPGTMIRVTFRMSTGP